MNISAMPKLDLHCHLDGSVRPETLLELSIEQGIKLPGTTLDELLLLARAPENCKSLVEYLDRFKLPLEVMQTQQALRRISNEFLHDCRTDGVVYAEVRFAPVLHMNKGLRFEEIIEAVLDGLEEGARSSGVEYGLIVCCMRHMNPKEAISTVDSATPYCNKGVLAIDLAGDEANFPPLLHREAFDKAKSKGFNITVHAGETGSSDNILNSVKYLYADRIGHGVAANKDPAVMEMLLDKNITLEMCPTSNIQTKAVTNFSEHPVMNYLNYGLNVTLNTDNRTVSNISSTAEFLKLIETFNPNLEQLKTLYLNSVNSSFANDATKQRLCSLWKTQV